jgi:hypothetical protein
MPRGVIQYNRSIFYITKPIPALRICLVRYDRVRLEESVDIRRKLFSIIQNEQVIPSASRDTRKRKFLFADSDPVLFNCD